MWRLRADRKFLWVWICVWVRHNAEIDDGEMTLAGHLIVYEFVVRMV